MAPPGHFTISRRTPTVTEYQRLRSSAGCDSMEEGAVERALGRSLFSVCATEGEELIGCGRVVGDGGLYFFIQDLMVDPRLEGQGIEDCIMSEIMDYLKETAPPGAFFCIKGCMFQREQCRQFGFQLDEEGRENPFQ